MIIEAPEGVQNIAAQYAHLCVCSDFLAYEIIYASCIGLSLCEFLKANYEEQQLIEITSSQPHCEHRLKCVSGITWSFPVNRSQWCQGSLWTSRSKGIMDLVPFTRKWRVSSCPHVIMPCQHPRGELSFSTGCDHILPPPQSALRWTAVRDLARQILLPPLCEPSLSQRIHQSPSRGLVWAQYIPFLMAQLPKSPWVAV